MQRVAIVGGTHGNELGGIYLCRYWLAAPECLRHFPFRVEPYLANSGAIAVRRRYLDQDLNRCFLPADLQNVELASYEAQRAKLLAHALGGTDFLIDLHNTTANMGLTVILSRAGALEDPLIRQLCAHLIQQDPAVRIYDNPVPPEQNPYLPSIALRDLTLEVGPMPHGTLRADLYFKTRQLVEAMLDFLARWHRGEHEAYSGELTIYHHLSNLDYPRTESGELDGMIHPAVQAHDFWPLSPGAPLFVTFGGREIRYEGDDTVWPVFINEQAYYEKNFAMSLTQKVVHEL
ncbi:MAG: aspartoacylase [Candidatus Melainabacteria bacterium HGW-Melainabacteria-1]|nr:MAG: aspartoacylase [Candidatus Melainabacteria bacterium HGW-Melainabacteria-1]